MLSDIDILDKQDKSYTYLSLIKTPRMRRLTLLTGIVWSVSPPQTPKMFDVGHVVDEVGEFRGSECFEPISLLSTCRYGVASTYYGISLNITGFGLNIYLTHFIFAAIEVPAKLVIFCCINMLGRRTCQAGTLILTGICLAINMVVPKGWSFSTFPDLTHFTTQEVTDHSHPNKRVS